MGFTTYITALHEVLKRGINSLHHYCASKGLIGIGRDGGGNSFAFIVEHGHPHGTALTPQA